MDEGSANWRELLRYPAAPSYLRRHRAPVFFYSRIYASLAELESPLQVQIAWPITP